MQADHGTGGLGSPQRRPSPGWTHQSVISSYLLQVLTWLFV